MIKTTTTSSQAHIATTGVSSDIRCFEKFLIFPQEIFRQSRSGITIWLTNTAKKVRGDIFILNICVLLPELIRLKIWSLDASTTFRFYCAQNCPLILVKYTNSKKIGSKIVGHFLLEEPIKNTHLKVTEIQPTCWWFCAHSRFPI